VSDDEARTTGSGTEHPWGTFVLMLLFLALIAGLWIWMYVILLQRG
jgi:hypothetical protein